jgi:DNA-binding beta-propeller fold protein YncE
MSTLASFVSLLLAAPVAGQAGPGPAASPNLSQAAQICPSPATDQTIKLPARPFAAEPARDNCYLFVSLMRREGGAVTVVINEQGNFRIARTVEVAGGGGLSLAHDGSLLAVAAGDSIVLLDVARLETPDQDPVVATLPDGGHGAIYAQFSRDDALLFVSEERNASIAVIDVAAARGGKGDKAIVARIGVGDAPVGLALSPDGATLFSTSQVKGSSDDCKPEREGGRTHAQGVLVAINVALAAQDPQHAVAGEIRAGCNPVRVVMSADGRNLWISQRGQDSVMSVDVASVISSTVPGKPLSLPVGRSPVGLAARPDGTQLWVANSDRFATVSGSLTVISPANPIDAKASGTLAVGAFPRDLRFMPDGRTLVVALYGDGAVLLHPTGNAN